MSRWSGALALGLAALAAWWLAPADTLPEGGSPDAAPARAERAPFDFYVLSLSWSPSFCARAGSGNELQCGARADHGFIVHGLWPQFEEGWPSYCAPIGEGPSRAARQALLEVMPSPGLIAHQWEKHGSCSGLAADHWVEAILAARQGVVIPAALRDAERSREMTPRAIEDAFLAGNPGLSRDGMAVICAGRRLIEVRLCLTPGLDFRGCREVRAETCRGNDPIALPAAP
ncbi:MAG: ribonuclease T2 [Hyphomicrobiaceae bacterium]|nr:ribonuclease T2 [Hyphomicrobiaceae bacterium]